MHLGLTFIIPCARIISYSKHIGLDFFEKKRQKPAA